VSEHPEGADVAFVIEGPDQMAHFAMCQVIGALRLEVNSGLKFSNRGSIMNLARQRYGCQKRTKAGVLKEMLVIYKTKYGREYGA